MLLPSLLVKLGQVQVRLFRSIVGFSRLGSVVVHSVLSDLIQLMKIQYGQYQILCSARWIKMNVDQCLLSILKVE